MEPCQAQVFLSLVRPKSSEVLSGPIFLQPCQAKFHGALSGPSFLEPSQAQISFMDTFSVVPCQNQISWSPDVGLHQAPMFLESCHAKCVPVALLIQQKSFFFHGGTSFAGLSISASGRVPVKLTALSAIRVFN